MADMTISAIAAMPEGRMKISNDSSRFVLIARRAGNFAIECGWAVPESHDDDYMSSTYHPFKGGKMHPWVGRRMVVADPAEALAIYQRWKSQVWSSAVPSEGEPIGSVSRS